MASANNPTIREEMKMTLHKKAPGGRWSIHQGQHGKSHCYENICIIPKSPQIFKGVLKWNR